MHVHAWKHYSVAKQWVGTRHIYQSAKHMMLPTAYIVHAAQTVCS